MNKTLKISKFWLSKAILVIVCLILALGSNVPTARAVTWSDLADLVAQSSMAQAAKIFSDGPYILMAGDSFTAVSAPQPNLIRVTVTAYSSTHDQTDDDPFVTASGKTVRDGIVAANFLPFGTKIKIPSAFGDKIFVVEDRMARKHSDKIDIWFPERWQAKHFGIKELEVEILEI